MEPGTVFRHYFQTAVQPSIRGAMMAFFDAVPKDFPLIEAYRKNTRNQWTNMIIRVASKLGVNISK
ncbi:hypothetical protein HK100_009092, partial [Physocladia obscura]